MAKIEKFNKATLTTLRNEMNALLSKYGVENGFNIETGKIKFSEHDCTIEVKVAIEGKQTFNDVILESTVKALGIKLVNSNGDRLVEYNSRSYKMPFIYVNAKDGKRYKCDEQTAKYRFSK